MTLWKKAVSGIATAALLSSLFASAALAVTGVGTVVKYDSDVDSRPADGLSYINLTFAASTIDTVTDFPSTLQVTASGATFLAGTGTFTGKTGTSISVVLAGEVAAGSQLWLASSTAGTATVTVSYTKAGLAQTDSIQSFTFTGVTTTTPSASYSSSTVTPSTVVATTSPFVNATGAFVTTKVRDTNNNPMSTGVTVKYEITGIGFFSNGQVTYTATLATDPVTGTFTSLEIQRTGASGVGTIKTTVKYLGVDYPLADKTITFVGAPSTVEAENSSYVLERNDALGYNEEALFVVVKDAAGQDIKAGLEFTDGAYTPSAIIDVDTASAVYNTSDKGWYLDVDCLDVGTATATVKVNATGSTTKKESNAVEFTCSKELTSTNLGTFSIDTTATTVQPNGQLALQASVKDVDGRKAPDGTVVTAVTNGVGNVVSSKGTNSAATLDGIVKFTFLAPANAGSATVTMFITNATPRSHSVTIGIGQAVDQPLAVSVKAGLPSEGGTYGTATPVVAPGKYITWRGQTTAAAAGLNVGIYVAVKNADGTWGAFTRLTSRTVDATGQALFYWRSSTPTWVSVRFGIESGSTTLMSVTRQGRWR